MVTKGPPMLFSADSERSNCYEDEIGLCKYSFEKDWINSYEEHKVKDRNSKNQYAGIEEINTY